MELVLKPGLSDSSHCMPPCLFMECPLYAGAILGILIQTVSFDPFNTLFLREIIPTPKSTYCMIFI